MIKLTPAVKGLITGILMVALLLIFYFAGVNDASPLRLLVYFIYGLGIVWTLVVYSQREQNLSFSNLFNIGFKCFIIVVIVMVVYTMLFYKIYYHKHPEIVENSLNAYRQHLISTEKNLTPNEIEERVKGVRENPIIGHIYKEILVDFFIGAIVTAATAGSLSLRKKN